MVIMTRMLNCPLLLGAVAIICINDQWTIALNPKAEEELTTEDRMILVDLLTRYSGEVDHLIPWQSDQAIRWRTTAAKAVKAFSKLANKLAIDSRLLEHQFFFFFSLILL